MNVKEFINAIHYRPQMYVEEIRMDHIYYLVVGFLGSNLINEEVSNIDQKFKTQFSNWTIKWIRENVDEKYKSENLFWYHIFNDVTNNEKEATELFFKLCDVFFLEFENIV